MLSTLAPTHNSYLDAVDYLDRLTKENKMNDTSVELFTLLFPKEIDILISQGYFHTITNHVN